MYNIYYGKCPSLTLNETLESEHIADQYASNRSQSMTVQPINRMNSAAHSTDLGSRCFDIGSRLATEYQLITGSFCHIYDQNKPRRSQWLCDTQQIPQNQTQDQSSRSAQERPIFETAQTSCSQCLQCVCVCVCVCVYVQMYV